MKILPTIRASDIPSLGMISGIGSSLRGSDIQEWGGSFGVSRNARFRENATRYFEGFERRINLDKSSLRLVKAITAPDRPRSLVSRDDLTYIPPSMRLAVLSYKPVRDAYLNGDIFGWEIDPDNLYKEDEDNPYERLALRNGRLDDIDPDDPTERFFETEYRSTDPDLTIDDLEHYHNSYDFIRYVMSRETYDPTNPDSERG